MDFQEEEGNVSLELVEDCVECVIYNVFLEFILENNINENKNKKLDS